MSILGTRAKAQMVQQSVSHLRPFSAYHAQHYGRTTSLHKRMKLTNRLWQRQQLGASEGSGALTPSIDHNLNGECVHGLAGLRTDQIEGHQASL